MAKEAHSARHHPQSGHTSLSTRPHRATCWTVQPNKQAKHPSHSTICQPSQRKYLLSQPDRQPGRQVTPSHSTSLRAPPGPSTSKDGRSRAEHCAWADDPLGGQAAEAGLGCTLPGRFTRRTPWGMGEGAPSTVPRADSPLGSTVRKPNAKAPSAIKK